MGRRRREVETPDYAAMVARMIRAHGRRVADADYVDLADLVALRPVLEHAILEAVRAQAERTSWATVALGLGTSRSAAFMRYSVKIAEAPR